MALTDPDVYYRIKNAVKTKEGADYMKALLDASWIYAAIHRLERK